MIDMAGGGKSSPCQIILVEIFWFAHRGITCLLKLFSDLLEINLRIIIYNGCRAGNCVGIHRLDPIHSLYGNPYRSRCIPSDTPRNLYFHGFFCGKNILKSADKERQGCNHHQRHHPLPSHTVSSFTMISLYYNSKRKNVQKFLDSLPMSLNSANNGTNLSEKKA